MYEILNKLKEKTGLSKDYIYKEFNINNIKVNIVFNEVLTSSNMINEFILKRLTVLEDKDLTSLENTIPDRNILIIEEKDILNYIHNGYIIILTEKKIYAFEERANLDRGIQTITSELTIKGPKDAFSENFNTNLGLIRRRIKTTNLECFDMSIGRETKTKVGILYMKNITDKDLIEKVKLKLSTIDIDGIIDSTYLKENLESKNNNFFPTIMSTERPDKVSMSLLEGKIAIIVDMSPYVLIMPNYFIDFFHTVDDYYQKPINTTFIRFVRLLAFFISIFVPALYIMVTTHNHEFVSLDMLLSLKAQRESVPFSAITEALFMMLCFEILRESDIRMSSTSGNAVSILGGLILGDAAVSAGIISPIMIIVVAISAISGLTFTSIELVSAIRWWRLILIILAAILGIWGIIIGTIILIIRLMTIKNFDRNYLTPLFPFIKTEYKDNIIKTSNKGEKYRNPTLTKNVKRGHFR
ncbi:MAG: spore germination protein [Bacilli bacterium]|nr:spore germination protein [Bacilli bacterium]